MSIHFFPAFALLAIFVICGCDSDSNDEQKSGGKTKVLIDTDMVEGFDDGIALMMMLSSADVDVVGVTTVTGNTWAQEGVAYGVRQMEICGVQNVPIIAGSQYPLREGRLSTLKDEVSANPGRDSYWLGASEYAPVPDWKGFYVEHYGEQPSMSATQDDAVDFIIRMLHAYPNELVILAIGPCTNIAKALQREPGIERLAKEIVYMGGCYFTDGNTTPYAEFNAIFDPEAMAVCLRAPFAKQTIVSLDVCNTINIDRDRYDDMRNKAADERLRQIFSNCYFSTFFDENPEGTSCIWDIISATVVLDADVATGYKDVRVDIQDNPLLPEYGRTYVTDNADRQLARVLTTANADRIWQLAYQIFSSSGATH